LWDKIFHSIPFSFTWTKSSCVENTKRKRCLWKHFLSKINRFRSQRLLSAQSWMKMRKSFFGGISFFFSNAGLLHISLHFVNCVEQFKPQFDEQQTEWGRCYDPNFRRTNWRLFLKTNVIIQILKKLAVSCTKNANF
jgi:hypothetical protein